MEIYEICPWDKKFETGIELIDEQHKQLFQILNELTSHLGNRSGPKALNKAFNDLAEYADYHFKTEDKVWGQYLKDDNWFADHDRQHKSFFADVISLKNEEKNKPLDDVIQNIVFFLSRWAARHILDSDRRMALAVQAIESGLSVEQAKNRADEVMSGPQGLRIDNLIKMYDGISERTLDLMKEMILRKKAEDETRFLNKNLESKVENRTHDLCERVKELGGLYSLSKVFNYSNVSLDEVLQKAVEVIPPAWHYPEITCARITFEGVDYVTKNFKETKWRQACDIFIDKDNVGKIEVFYLVEKPELYEGPFLKEERSLIEEMATRTGQEIKRNKSEERLRKLSQAVEQSPASVIITDTSGVIEYVNQKFTEINGYSAEEAIGQNPSLLKSGETSDSVYENLWTTLKSGKNWHGTLRNKRKNGSVYLSGASISPIIGPDGVNTHYLATMQDITQKIEDENRLKQADKMESIGGLAGGIAHDFNNMLLPILSLTDMTRKALPEDSRDRIRLDKVIEAANRAKELVAKILAFSRHEDAQQENIDIYASIHEALDLLHSTLPSTVKITEKLEIDTGTVFADRAQMASVLMNLASNAADAMEGHTGEMEVSLSPVKVSEEKATSIQGLKAGKYAKLVVEDNGHGMDAKTLARIKDPFFTTKEVGKGTGLGLSMVHGIIYKHDGAIDISSTPGKGTTIEIYLPLVEGEAEQEAQTHKH